jgi:bifunctional UDP-N-acetylglucosamine pyrophosphorylase/glucosamine-1-phosphate N-acetyltransferase|tara:strand:+ start:4571 stop:5203 length:633 start_codon:yes stop_codon:yes gene_type:complete
MNSKNKKNFAYQMRQKQEKIRNKFMKEGVMLVAPETIFLSSNIRFGKNVVINPYVVIGSKVKIGSNVEILSFTHIENATIENNVKVGPFSRIRPGAILSKGSKVGNFVEIKNSRVGARSKINHLSYVGDTTIGKSTNIGAGTITCNYDGKRKNRTKIQDEVFIGSNSSLVAPVIIGKKSVIGAGSVITKNVRKGSLVLARAKQIEKKKYK